MKNNLCIFLLLFISFQTEAQKPAAKNSDNNNFTIYKVQKSEGWYAIARKFNISYTELRLANKKTGDELIEGSEVFVPSTKLKSTDPFYQKNYIDKSQEIKKPRVNAEAKKKFHVVEPSQTLYSISKMYNITVEEIKDWNNLNSNSISVGQKLIISAVTETKNVIEEKPVAAEKKEAPKLIPIVVPPDEISSDKSDIQAPPSKVVKPVEANEDTTLVTSDVENIKYSSEPPFEKKKEAATKNEADKKEDDNVQFGNGRKETRENGTAEIITDESGNQDKYYALHSTAPLGTIVRVLNMSNSRKIYVKIIGKIPDTEQNEGLLIKLSKPCATKLETTEKRFQVNLLYGTDEIEK